MPTPQIIYQFKVTLLDIHPAIWRRIQVPETYTFWDLHVAIQSAMGWSDSHLHRFAVGGDEQIIINGNPIDDRFDINERALNGWETEISRFLNGLGDVAIYEYDMGDDWLHEILLEGILLKEKGTKYPRCLAGACACPPEDCGGAPGFEHLLEVLASPQHPEHKDLIDWLGEEYDPKKFDLAAIKFTNPKTQWKYWQKMN